MLSKKTKATIQRDLIEVLLKHTKNNKEFLEAVIYALEIFDTELEICEKIVIKRYK